MKKLYEYQEELLNYGTSGTVLMDWARGAGMDYALAQYILKFKPRKIACVGYENSHLIEELQSNFDKSGAYPFFKSDKEFSFEFNDGVMITIERFSLFSSLLKGRRFDLVIFGSDIAEKNICEFDKCIYALSQNTETLNIERMQPNHLIIVDHKRMLKENLDMLDIVLDGVKSERYYRDFAINDKQPKESDLSFKDFQDRALKKLQKQFLSTPDTKDTVLTRKNIIEMIKDLKELGV